MQTKGFNEEADFSTCVLHIYGITCLNINSHLSRQNHQQNFVFSDFFPWHKSFCWKLPENNKQSTAMYLLKKVLSGAERGLWLNT